MAWKVIAPIAVVGVVAGGWYLMNQPAPQSEPVIVVETAPPVVVEVMSEPVELVVEEEVEPIEAPSDVVVMVEQEIVMPPVQLDNSDTTVLKAVADLSPSLGQWLITQEQLRKWVLAVDNLADGKLPGRYNPISYHMAHFVVDKDGAEYDINDANYDRANRLINAITEIDPETAALYYKAWLPLLEEAYDELGKPGTFDARLHEAVKQILVVQAVPKEAKLVQPHVFYDYENKNLQDQSDVTKWVWRLGEANREKMQTFLIEFNQSLQ